MKKRQPSHVSLDRWMISYADFVTLLLAFFIVLYASSQADKQKMSQLATAISKAFQSMGANPGAVPLNLKIVPNAPANIDAESVRRASLQKLQQTMEQMLASEIKQHAIVIHQNNDGLVISLRELGFYQSGSAVIRSDAMPVFQQIANELKQHPWKIRIEGHTDNVPIHTALFNSNWELSTARSTEIVRMLVENYQINPEYLSAAGYGEFHPVAANDSEEGRRQNRRVDIVILGLETTTPSSPQ